MERKPRPSIEFVAGPKSSQPPSPSRFRQPPLPKGGGFIFSAPDKESPDADFSREWHRAVKRVVVAHMKLAKSVKPSERKLAQKECDTALAEFRIADGKRLDRVNQYAPAQPTQERLSA
jgi:hypothetical protein